MSTNANWNRQSTPLTAFQKPKQSHSCLPISKSNSITHSALAQGDVIYIIKRSKGHQYSSGGCGLDRY